MNPAAAVRGPKYVTKRGTSSGALVPTAGFCLAIWLSLPVPAKIVGGVWFAAGIAYGAVKTRGFRHSPAMISLDEV